MRGVPPGSSAHVCSIRCLGRVRAAVTGLWGWRDRPTSHARTRRRQAVMGKS
jgi:hypothetical protein